MVGRAQAFEMFTHTNPCEHDYGQDKTSSVEWYGMGQDFSTWSIPRRHRWLPYPKYVENIQDNHNKKYKSK